MNTEQKYFAAAFALFISISVLFLILPKTLVEPDDEVYRLAMETYSQGRFTLERWDRGNVLVGRDSEGERLVEKPPGYGMWLAFLHIFNAETLSNIFLTLLVLGLAYSALYMIDFPDRNRFFLLLSILLLTNPTFLAMGARPYMADLGSALITGCGLLLYMMGDSTGKIRFFACAGFVTGLGVSFRYTGIFSVIVILLWEAWLFFSHRELDLKRMAFFGAGLFFALVPLFIYHSAYFGSPFATGYDRRLGLGSRQSLFGWDNAVFSLKYIFTNFRDVLPRFLQGYPLVLFLPLGLFAFPDSKKRYGMLFLFWILVFGGIYYTYSVTPMMNYFFCCRKFLPILLPLCLFAACALSSMEARAQAALVAVLVIFSLAVFSEYASTYLYRDALHQHHPPGPSMPHQAMQLRPPHNQQMRPLGDQQRTPQDQHRPFNDQMRPPLDQSRPPRNMQQRPCRDRLFSPENIMRNLNDPRIREMLEAGDADFNKDGVVDEFEKKIQESYKTGSSK